MANYILLERIELNASTSSVTFSNIPQSGYTDLKLVISARSTRSDYTFGSISIVFNSTTSGYSYNWLKGDGTNPNTGTGSSIAYLLDLYTAPSSTATANTFGNNEIYIPNYTSSNFKSVSIDAVAENNATLAQAILTAGLWSNTAAINSITLSETNGNAFTQYSTFSLYGLAAVGSVPAIAPKASGGSIYNDGTYWYHAFRTSGTFTPQISLSADVIVIAGGGGGSGTANAAGSAPGGGAGGLLAFTSQSLTATSYTCTIGAGGSGGAVNAQGSQGANSQFGALTAAVGGGRAGLAIGTGSATAGGTGGSGGGGGYSNNSPAAGGSATSSQGYAGGSGSTFAYSGGGGGSAEAGNTDGQGYGGDGLSTYSSWGAATNTGELSGGVYYFAGGGSGRGNAADSGGLGGGALGGSQPNGNGQTALINTGGGGGGAGDAYPNSPTASGGAGGSGLIIIRYPIA